MYVTPEAVRLALSPSADTHLLRGGGAGLADTQVNDCILRADSRIDLYLSGTYITPIETTGDTAPEPVRTWAQAMAAYYATCIMRGVAALNATEPAAVAYVEAIAELKMVQAGQATLSVPAIPVPVPEDDDGTDGVVNLPYVGLAADAACFPTAPFRRVGFVEPRVPVPSGPKVTEFAEDEYPYLWDR